MWVPSLSSFPGLRHTQLFSGGPKWGAFGWGPKVYVENVYVLFRPLRTVPVLGLNGSFEEKVFSLCVYIV